MKSKEGDIHKKDVLLKIKFIKHNKENYDEICLNCSSDDIEEIIGWCYNHGAPDLGDNGLFFCNHQRIEAFISQVKGAFFCHNCDFIYDKNKMIKWNNYDFLNGCPVGEEYEETPYEYTERLFAFLVKYEESKINECLEKGYYLEAIGTLHIQISDQLRYLLIKKVKGHENIPLDYTNKRFKSVLKWVKKLKDHELYHISYIFHRITKEEWDKLSKLNILRNKFSHSFDERKKYSEQQVKNIVDKAKKIENRLKIEVSKYGIIDSL